MSGLITVLAWIGLCALAALTGAAVRRWRQFNTEGVAMKSLHAERPKFNGWTRWVQPIVRGYRMTCCDCGLTHIMQFRVMKGKIQFRACRAKNPLGRTVTA